MVINAYITNLGKYNEGCLMGKWVPFPTTREKLRQVFREIGIDGVRYEEFFITDYNIDLDIPRMYQMLGEYAHLDELNYLAAKLEELDEGELQRFCGAVSVYGAQETEELITLVDNLDSFNLIPDVSNETELGEYLFEQDKSLFAEMVSDMKKSYDNGKRMLAAYIARLEQGYDPEGQGRDFTFSVTGDFCGGGYLYMCGGVENNYTGLDDIPEEYRVLGTVDEPQDCVVPSDPVKLLEIEAEQARQIIETREPKGRYYYRNGDGVLIGIDNSTGHAWTEEFGNDFLRCMMWLNGQIEMDAKE